MEMNCLSLKPEEINKSILGLKRAGESTMLSLHLKHFAKSVDGIIGAYWPGMRANPHSLDRNCLHFSSSDIQVCVFILVEL